MERKTQFTGSAGAGGGAHEPHRGSSAWVERFLSSTATGGRMLDVACGKGRHMRLALERGFAATGVDRDIAGVADLEGRADVKLIKTDLEAGGPWPLRGRMFGAVVVTNYLWRPILPDIVAAVAPDGVLIYETFGLGNERYGKPSNPAFLLRPGELIDAVSGRLTPIAYEHVTLEGQPPRIVQRIVAVGARHAWLKEPPAGLG